MTTPPPDLGQLGLCADALRIHAFLRAAFRSPDVAYKSVRATNYALTGDAGSSTISLGQLATVLWHLDQCLVDGAFSMSLVVGSLPGMARGGPAMAQLVAVCERLGLPPCPFVAEASRSLVEASLYAARQVGAGADLTSVAAIFVPNRTKRARAFASPFPAKRARVPLAFPSLEHKPTMCAPLCRAIQTQRRVPRELRPAGWHARADKAVNRSARSTRVRARRAALAGQKEPKSHMLYCARQFPAPQTQGDPVPGHPAAEVRATEAPGTPPPPPSTTPDGGKIGPAVGLDASPEDSKTLAGNELAAEVSKSDKSGPEL